MSIKMVAIHDTRHRIYLSPFDGDPTVFHYGCTQEISDPEILKRRIEYLRR